MLNNFPKFSVNVLGTRIYSNNLKGGVPLIDKDKEIQHVTSNKLIALLGEISLQIFVVNKSAKLLFSNSKLSKETKVIHEYIEQSIQNRLVNIQADSIIRSCKVYSIDGSEIIYKVSIQSKQISGEQYVTRKEIYYENQVSVLYTHQDVKNELTEETRSQKIIRANELIMEIRDIVDHVDDLHEIFSYLLSKIHTVIPAANRSCILRLDDEEQLYLDVSYGFNDEYIKEFRLPFKSSYAYMHMQNDYTKSVIIDDVQEKYSNLFPDVKDENVGFKIQSNVTIPIVVNGTLFGIVSVDSDENHVFDFVDLNLLDFIKVQLERSIDKYRAYRKIKGDSMIDSLTGVSNRRHLMDILPGYKEKAKLDEKQFLFVIFDLDKLKHINDTYGHVYGDMVIKNFANTIHKNIRESDFFARIGGDEFVGLFYNLDEIILQERIKLWETQFKNDPIKIENNIIYIQFSYGISVFPEEGNYFSNLLELSDKRMYKQKRSKN